MIHTNFNFLLFQASPNIIANEPPTSRNISHDVENWSQSDPTIFSDPDVLASELSDCAPHARSPFKKVDDNINIPISSACSAGLCYSCAGRITTERMGITCEICGKVSYHDVCIPLDCNMPNYDDKELVPFTCQLCFELAMSLSY